MIKYDYLAHSYLSLRRPLRPFFLRIFYQKTLLLTRIRLPLFCLIDTLLFPFYNETGSLKSYPQGGPMATAPSRLIFGLIPWYSFLIVTGAALAVYLGAREEKRAGLKKDTVIDFALWALPIGIIGARIYYVAFSWDSYKDDLLSVMRIWEGGIAIYGGVIAGLITAWFFCKHRNISFFTLCDVIAPGLVLAQAIGRWGNYFNQEAYGLAVSNPSLQFFPFAVFIEADGLWHMATFFYESLWNLLVFLFLIRARRVFFRYRGDVISFYALLYACGRLIIEDFRMDSLYAAQGLRISQLLSVVLCLFVLGRYVRLFRACPAFAGLPCRLFLCAAGLCDLAAAAWMLNLIPYTVPSVFVRFLLLSLCSVLNMLALFLLYGKCAEGEIIYADHQN